MVPSASASTATVTSNPVVAAATATASAVIDFIARTSPTTTGPLAREAISSSVDETRRMSVDVSRTTAISLGMRPSSMVAFRPFGTLLEVIRELVVQIPIELPRGRQGSPPERQHVQPTFEVHVASVRSSGCQA